MHISTLQGDAADAVAIFFLCVLFFNDSLLMATTIAFAQVREKLYPFLLVG